MFGLYQSRSVLVLKKRKKKTGITISSVLMMLQGVRGGTGGVPIIVERDHVVFPSLVDVLKGLMIGVDQEFG